MNAPYLLDQTRHWKPMVNGYSSFAPSSFFERVERLNRFPEPQVIEEMKRIGISHVMLEHAALEPQFGREAFTQLRSIPISSSSSIRMGGSFTDFAEFWRWRFADQRLDLWLLSSAALDFFATVFLAVGFFAVAFLATAFFVDAFGFFARSASPRT